MCVKRAFSICPELRVRRGFEGRAAGEGVGKRRERGLPRSCTCIGSTGFSLPLICPSASSRDVSDVSEGKDSITVPL